MVLGVPAFLVPFRPLRRRPVGRAGMKVIVGALTGLGMGFLLIMQMYNGATEVREAGFRCGTLAEETRTAEATGQ